MNFEEFLESQEQIIGVVDFNRKLVIFTPDKVYTMRRLRWYERLWNWLTR